MFLKHFFVFIFVLVFGLKIYNQPSCRMYSVLQACPYSVQCPNGADLACRQRLKVDYWPRVCSDWCCSLLRLVCGRSHSGSPRSTFPYNRSTPFAAFHPDSAHLYWGELHSGCCNLINWCCWPFYSQGQASLSNRWSAPPVGSEHIDCRHQCKQL